jgi:hypothetical protein
MKKCLNSETVRKSPPLHCYTGDLFHFLRATLFSKLFVPLLTVRHVGWRLGKVHCHVNAQSCKCTFRDQLCGPNDEVANASRVRVTYASDVTSSRGPCAIRRPVDPTGRYVKSCVELIEKHRGPRSGTGVNRLHLAAVETVLCDTDHRQR